LSGVTVVITLRSTRVAPETCHVLRLRLRLRVRVS
jgi:hypothetical protein